MDTTSSKFVNFEEFVNKNFFHSYRGSLFPNQRWRGAVVWSGPQLQKVVVMHHEEAGNRDDPDNTPYPDVPADMYNAVQARDDISILFTSFGHIYFSVERSEFVLRETMGPLSSHVTAACFTGALLALGTAVGDVFVYRIRRTSDLLLLDLNKWFWRGQQGGRRAVMDVQARANSSAQAIHVLYMKSNGVFAHQVELSGHGEEG